MRLIFLTLIFACLVVTPLVGQHKSPLLKWQANKPLSWEHFKGKPDATDVVHAAVTYAGIALSIESVGLIKGNTTFNAWAVFDQKQSWVHPSHKDQRVLAHEQLHFNITEIYARKLRNKLNALNLTRHDKKRIKKLQQIYKQAQLATQAQFDEETLHGLNTEREQSWRTKIQQELKFTGSSMVMMPGEILSQKAEKK